MTVLTAVRTSLPPGVECPPPECPVEANTLIYVIYGALDVRVGERVEYLANGDQLQIPAGTRHSWATPADSGAELVVVTAAAPLTSSMVEV